MTGDPIWSSLVWSPLCHSLPCKCSSVLSRHISAVLISQALTLSPAPSPSLPITHPSSLPPFTGRWIAVFALNGITSPPVLSCLSCQCISMKGNNAPAGPGHVFIGCLTAADYLVCFLLFPWHSGNIGVFVIRDVAQLMSTTTWQKTDFVKCKYSSDLGNKTQPEKLQKLKSATKKTLKCHTNLERVAINRLYYHACVRGEAKQMQVSSELSCGLVFSVSSKPLDLWYLDEFIFW